MCNAVFSHTTSTAFDSSFESPSPSPRPAFVSFQPLPASCLRRFQTMRCQWSETVARNNGGAPFPPWTSTKGPSYNLLDLLAQAWPNARSTAKQTTYTQRYNSSKYHVNALVSLPSPPATKAMPPHTLISPNPHGVHSRWGHHLTSFLYFERGSVLFSVWGKKQLPMYCLHTPIGF